MTEQPRPDTPAGEPAPEGRGPSTPPQQSPPQSSPPPGYPPPGDASPGYPPPGYAPPGYPPPGYAPVPYAPPGPAPGLAYAGFLPRLGAYLIDNIMVAIPVTIIFFAVYWSDVKRQIDSTPSGQTATIVISGGFYLIAGLIAGAYFLLLWMSSGRTLGMRALGLRVVQVEDGALPAVDRLVIRTAFFCVPLLIQGVSRSLSSLASLVALLCFISVAWDPRRQGWHDKVARTLVVREVGR